MLLFVWQFDPRGNKVGGIGKYVLSFIRQLSFDIEIGVIGVTTRKEEVGKWHIITIGNNKINFFPVCYVVDENIKKLLPLSLNFSYGLFKYRASFKSNYILFHQRLEYVLPLLYIRNKQYCLAHYDINQYLDKKNGESYWCHFPALYRMIMSLVLNRINGLFSVNNNTIAYIKKYFKSFDGSLSFTPTWADPVVFNYQKKLEEYYIKEVRNRFNIPSNDRVILVIGRLNDHKNIDLTLDVIVRLKQVKLIVVGDGPAKNSLVNKAETLGITNKVMFIGRLEQLEITKLYYAASFYLSTSNTEGMSVALLESLNMGVPVVTTPTGEAMNVVTKGLNGHVSTDWNVEELVMYSNEIMDNPKLYQRNIIIESIKKITPECITLEILKKMGLAKL